MYILENVPLAGYSTMRVGGPARYLADVRESNEIPQYVSWSIEKKVPLLMIGGGSNIIWSDEGFDGLVLVNKIKKFEISSFDDDTAYVTVGAGEHWDSVVARTVEEGLSGIEQLSLIPGSTGATPVQNVGAYGQEISNVLMTLQAYDLHERKFVTMTASDCEFGYRNSRFKSTDRDRFLITEITMILSRRDPIPPFYDSVEAYLKSKNEDKRTAKIIREAVIAIRKKKLPDPNTTPNNGSFFKNPMIDRSALVQLRMDYPDIAYWDIDDYSAKLSAAWLIEHAGYKDYHDDDTGMATWKNQPLVFVNEKARSSAQVLEFRDKIVAAVQDKFNVRLQQEPELLP